MKLNKQGISIIVGAFLCFLLSYVLGYNIGWERGVNIGFKAATDSVIVMAKRQLRSDTSVTRFVIVNPDTTTFILSRKTILNETK